jgi:hypothetical protein
MMYRAWFHLGVAVLLASLPVIACGGGDSSTPVSPTAVPAGLIGVNPDGSTLKVTKPVPQSPVGGERLNDQKPVFRFTNAQGLHVAVDLGYELHLLTEGGQLIYSQPVVRGAGETVHGFPGTLEINTPYSWRVRAVYQGHVGPWSDTGSFITVDRPIITPETMEAYLHQFAQGNPEWAACTAGSGTACFRFVWDVAQSMNPNCDPSSWGLLSKNPGDWQCTRSQCGNLGGQGFGEDILTYGGWSPIGAWDIIIGAGAPGASLSASYIAHRDRRPGNNWACPWR